MDISIPVAPHAKKEDFSVSTSYHKMQLAEDQQAKEHKMQQAKVSSSIANCACHVSSHLIS